MRARAGVVAEADGRGGARLARMRSEPPLALRSTAEAVYLVGGAAGPLGGDEVALDIVVAPGATLTVRSAAASVVLPGRGAAPSIVAVTARVGAGAELRWLPEPTVLVRGCRHRIDACIDVADGGRVVWREELVLGRHEEEAGSVRSRLTVDVAARPLVRQELDLGPDHPASTSPAVTGGARAVGSVTVVGYGAPAVSATFVGADATAAVLDLDGPGFQVVAVAADRCALAAALESGWYSRC